MSRLVVASCLALAAGCAANDAAQLMPNNTRCSTNADCLSGSTCIKTQCVPDSESSIDLSLLDFEISPPAESGYVTAQLLGKDYRTSAGTLFSVPKPVTFSCSVFDAVRDPITARVTIFGDPVARIPGRAVDQTLVVATAPVPVGYLPGPHVVRLEPIDQSSPGWETDFLVRSASSAQNGIKEYEQPALPRLMGEVVLRSSVETTVPGVQVRVYAQPSGLPSTTTITDVNGGFAVDLPNAASTTSFEIHADLPAQPSWGFVETLAVGAVQDRSFVVHLERTSTDSIGLAAIRVVGLGADGKPEPVARASVTLTAGSTLSAQIYSVRAVSGDDGYLSLPGSEPAPDHALQLLRARYTIDVDTGSDSDYRRLHSGFDLTSISLAARMDTQIGLSRRVPIAGQVNSAFGRPVAGARVEIEALETIATIATASADGSGQFTALLDPGRYLAKIVPLDSVAGGELLPVGFSGAIEVPDAPPGEVIQLPAITLPTGAVLHGTVAGADGEPLAGSDVEVFAEVSGRAVSLGLTSADTSGAFSIVLPISTAP
jgi:hypothetical protein